MSDYTAADIKIIDDPEERFVYAKTADLAKRYRSVPEPFIARLLEACELSGWLQDQAIARYLDGDKTIEPPADFYAVFRELADQRPRGSGRSVP